MDTNKISFKNFEHPYVTVDTLIFSIIDNQMCILLSKRQTEPFMGSPAIPGAFVQINESLDDAAKRVVDTKTSVSNVYFEQLYSFGKIDRDPRARIISVAYIALVSNTDIKDKSDWYPVNNLPKLPFDHKEVIEYAVDRIRNKIGYSTLTSGLLRKKFRMSELQKVYEIILGKPIDKRNFRKKMFSIGLLEATGEKEIVGKHRPAMLYRFKNKGLEFFD